MSYRLAFAALIALQLTGCADFARWLRQYTYPPQFRYLERDELRSAMRQLAFHSRELNRLIQSADETQQRRNEILMHLRAMEEAAESELGSVLTTKCFMILRSPTKHENGGIFLHMVLSSTRHSRAEPAPAKAWSGNPGDGQRPSYRWKTVSRSRGWGWTPVFTGVTTEPGYPLPDQSRGQASRV